MNTALRPMYKGESVKWPQAERTVYKLQKRIYRAAEGGNRKQVRRLQKLLLRSRTARLLAVRQVTQDNRGKRSPGVDGKASLTPTERMKLVDELQLEEEASAVRRVEIPKPGTNETRPLGIPTIADRAKQSLVKLVLEPEWEAQFEANSYGFRPGRTWDAVGAIYVQINQKPKWALDADIAKCFDRIDHATLLRKIDANPAVTRQIKAWLKAGVVDKGELFPTAAGTPQGGTISPLLANIALHGLEELIEHRYPGRNKPALIRYADDVRHITRRQIPFTERRGSEEQTFGSTAYPLVKAKRNNSMPLTQEGSEDVYDLVLQDPRNMVKTALFEAQSPGMKAYILRPQRLKAESSR